MLTMRSIVRAALANCHLEIQNKLEIQNVLYDIVDVVEASHMNKEISDLQKKLVASELSTEILRTEMNVLSSDKVFNDLEFDRIRSKAVYVRECLVHDLASILSERKQISDYLKRIRELEDRVVELVSFVEKGGQRGNAENVPPPIRTDLQSVDTADPIYEFADSVVQRINKSSIASKCPNGLHTQLNFPKKLGSLEDVCLLLTLSYLDISVVLNVSQVNRHLFARLDRLFQNGSLLVKESWLTVSLELMEVDDTIENNSQVTDLSVIDVEGCERSVTSASDINKAHSINATDESAGSVSMKGPGGEARYFGKFSMLLAAADMLPTGLTAGVMSAVGVKMNAIPSSPASSNGSTYVNSSSVKKIGGNPSNYPISAPGVQSILPAPSSSGGLTREIAESLSKKLSGNQHFLCIGLFYFMNISCATF